MSEIEFSTLAELFPFLWTGTLKTNHRGLIFHMICLSWLYTDPTCQDFIDTHVQLDTSASVLWLQCLPASIRTWCWHYGLSGKRKRHRDFKIGPQFVHVGLDRNIINRFTASWIKKVRTFWKKLISARTQLQMSNWQLIQSVRIV